MSSPRSHSTSTPLCTIKALNPAAEDAFTLEQNQRFYVPPRNTSRLAVQASEVQGLRESTPPCNYPGLPSLVLTLDPTAYRSPSSGIGFGSDPASSEVLLAADNHTFISSAHFRLSWDPQIPHSKMAITTSSRNGIKLDNNDLHPDGTASATLNVGTSYLVFAGLVSIQLLLHHVRQGEWYSYAQAAEIFESSPYSLAHIGFIRIQSTSETPRYPGQSNGTAQRPLAALTDKPERVEEDSLQRTEIYIKKKNAKVSATDILRAAGVPRSPCEDLTDRGIAAEYVANPTYRGYYVDFDDGVRLCNDLRLPWIAEELQNPEITKYRIGNGGPDTDGRKLSREGYLTLVMDGHTGAAEILVGGRQSGPCAQCRMKRRRCDHHPVVKDMPARKARCEQCRLKRIWCIHHFVVEDMPAGVGGRKARACEQCRMKKTRCTHHPVVEDMPAPSRNGDSAAEVISQRRLPSFQGPDREDSIGASMPLQHPSQQPSQHALSSEVALNSGWDGILDQCEDDSPVLYTATPSSSFQEFERGARRI